jgi:hypothetical protein
VRCSPATGWQPGAPNSAARSNSSAIVPLIASCCSLAGTSRQRPARPWSSPRRRAG